MNWSAPTDPDAPQPAKDAGWVEAFRGISQHGDDFADLLATDAAEGKAHYVATATLERIAERILNMQTLIEQNAAVRVDGSELVMARTNREAAEAVTRQATAGVRMGAQTGRIDTSKPNLNTLPSSAAAKIEAARAARATAGEPDREHDRNTIEANPLGGDR